MNPKYRTDIHSTKRDLNLPGLCLRPTSHVGMEVDGEAVGDALGLDDGEEVGVSLGEKVGATLGLEDGET